MSRQVLEEIATWKLDAKYDDNARYFYYKKEANLIEDDQKWFIIGRKGNGKSALSEYLYRTSSPDVFTVKLSFKNFPFNLLYSLNDGSYTAPNQYISLWKFLIYSSVCKLIAHSPSGYH